MSPRLKWWLEQPQHDDWDETCRDHFARKAEDVSPDDIPGLCRDAPGDIWDEGNRYAAACDKYASDRAAWWRTQPLWKDMYQQLRMFEGAAFSHQDANALGFNTTEYIAMAHSGATEEQLRTEANRFYAALALFRRAQEMCRKNGRQPWEDDEAEFNAAFEEAVNWQ
jgi:hypothetical protein